MEHMNDSIRRAVRVSLAERDMTQSDLAEKVGVTPQYVSRIMQGQVGKIPEAWQKILDALDLELVAVPKMRYGAGGYGGGGYGGYPVPPEPPKRGEGEPEG